MKHLLAVLILGSSASCSEPGSVSEVSVDAPTKDSLLCAVDTSGFEILPYQRWIGFGDVVQDSLHPLELRDFEKVECLLVKELKAWNSDTIHHHYAEAPIELHRYGRQYCALTNEQGHRLVYLNAFCRDHGSIQGWIVVEDGGHCYFQALFDLTSGSLLHFSVNGVA